MGSQMGIAPKRLFLHPGGVVAAIDPANAFKFFHCTASTAAGINRNSTSPKIREDLHGPKPTPAEIRQSRVTMPMTAGAERLETRCSSHQAFGFDCQRSTVDPRGGLRSECSEALECRAVCAGEDQRRPQPSGLLALSSKMGLVQIGRNLDVAAVPVQSRCSGGRSWFRLWLLAQLNGSITLSRIESTVLNCMVAVSPTGSAKNLVAAAAVRMK